MKPANPLRLTGFLFATALSLSMGRASATPLYYSFQGEVVYSNVDSYALGRQVQYVFMVDKDVDGYIMDGNGAKQVQTDYYETLDWYTLSFLSVYVGGDALTADDPASSTRQSYFYGRDQFHYESDLYSDLSGSNSDPTGLDFISVSASGYRFNDWVPGMSLVANNVVVSGDGEEGPYIASSGVLNSITDYNPLTATAAVPEPSSFALFGFALMALGLVSRRLKSKRPNFKGGISGRVPGLKARIE